MVSESRFIALAPDFGVWGVLPRRVPILLGFLTLPIDICIVVWGLIVAMIDLLSPALNAGMRNGYCTIQPVGSGLFFPSPVIKIR